jgi:hypothetical protein
MPTYEELIAKLPAGAFVPQGKFVPKLAFDIRCEILALYRQGVGRSVLAQAFGVDRRTITHIYTKKSPHYKNIRAEEDRLGTEEFCRTYITEAGVARISAIRDSDGGQDPNKPRKASNRAAGFHNVRNEFTTNAHRILVEWRDNEEEFGWYYRDLDGENPEQWLHNGDESKMTSNDCLKALKDAIFDV